MPGFFLLHQNLILLPDTTFWLSIYIQECIRDGREGEYWLFWKWPGWWILLSLALFVALLFLILLLHIVWEMCNRCYDSDVIPDYSYLLLFNLNDYCIWYICQAEIYDRICLAIWMLLKFCRQSYMAWWMVIPHNLVQ